MIRKTFILLLFNYTSKLKCKVVEGINNTPTQAIRSKASPCISNGTFGLLKPNLTQYYQRKYMNCFTFLVVG